MFKPVDPKINFAELEQKILSEWEKSGLVNRYLAKNNSSDKKFSFLDGPITANNPMGVHHAWGRAYKDLYQRFNNMRGYKQRFQNGFDCQGLWVEVEVEKELGFKSKKDIETYGIEKFVNKCKERAQKYADIQTEQSKRLGYFMDWDHSYYTMSDENNYMIWHMLKKCWENGWIYKGKDSVPWCPRCGTAISQHEILTEEYQEKTHTSVYFKCFRIDVDYPSAFLVWTTTPWTIPADIALAVNPDFTYAEFEIEGEKESLVFAKDLGTKILKDKNWKIKKEFKGEKLLGEHYTAPFDYLPINEKTKKENPEKFHTVVLDKDLVTEEEGTGIVHLVPGAGTEDFQVGKRENLPVVEVIDEAANYLDGYGELSGKNAKDNPDLVFEMLKKIEDGKYLYKLENYTHRYPQCWRCKTELVWRVVNEWYIKMDPLREPMKNVVGKIKWIPSWGKDQELDWLKNMHDWLISKKRYWGLALPIWECECGHFEIIGSKEELKEKAIEGWEEFAGNSPHRPWVDAVKIKCPKCGKTVSRIKDVGNPWLDAGIVSFSTLIDPETKKVSYTTDKKYWADWFPADFVTESFPGQFKNWFYSLLVMSTVLENTNPFNTLFGYATVLDEKGEEMHKSKGNAIWFDEAAEKMGVDVMRWLYMIQNPQQNLLFGYNVADETRRKFHLILWNIYNFFVTYANIDNWEDQKSKIKNQNDNLKSKNILDQWIISRLNELIKIVTESLEKYDAFTASHAIEDFVLDLSTWFVRRSRDRIGPSVEEGEDKNACYQTLFEVLTTSCQLLAPFMPFISEHVYQNLTNEESVHLTGWPAVGEIDENLHKNMILVRKICELGHAKRKEAGIKVRQPLASAKCKVQSVKLNQEYLQLICDELNLKKVEWEEKKTQDPIVELDLKITSELKEEGEARELVRQIQEKRKELGCALAESIALILPSWPEKYENLIKKETLAKNISKGEQIEITRF